MNRLLVIGLDGATLDLIGPWTRDGRLPTFARLIERGAPGFCYPPGFVADFERATGASYRIDSRISQHIKTGRINEGIRAAYATAERHADAALFAMAQGAWDLAVIVFSLPDEMQHFFWRQMAAG